MKFRPDILILAVVLSAISISAHSQQKMWAWMHGDTINPVYRPKPNDYRISKKKGPSHRRYATSWTDDEGNFWLFGGIDATGSEFNDLWKFDHQKWQLIGGDTTSGNIGYSGTIGKPDPKNWPSARLRAGSDYYQGKFYLFGGWGYDSLGEEGSLNDLWVWDGLAWTRLSGAPKESSPAVFGERGIPSHKNTPAGKEYSSISVDAKGNVWLFAGESDNLWRWNERGWAWMSGSGGGPSLKRLYFEKNEFNKNANPGYRHSTNSWIDKDGHYTIFGGTLSYLNDTWKWMDSGWVWVAGDTIKHVQAKFGSLGQHSPAYYPGSQAKGYPFQWKNSCGDMYFLFSLAQGQTWSPKSLQLWKWNGHAWGLIDSSYTGTRFGEKGIPSLKNSPGWRSEKGSAWIDSLNNLWLEGGGVYDRYSGMWRYGTEPTKGIKVSGNGVSIGNGDTLPKIENLTDFGSVPIYNSPIVKTFAIGNFGNAPIRLAGKSAVKLKSKHNYFRLKMLSQHTSISDCDSILFEIQFAPKEEGQFLADVEIKSNDPSHPIYMFRITGVGLPPNKPFLSEVTCSSAKLGIRWPIPHDFYTVIISDSGILELPVNGENYNYSPNYLKASILKDKARVLYQGTKLNLPITNLISNRRYQILVVPGNGPAGNTIYETDSANVLYFETPPSRWKDSVEISPPKDSGVCEIDTLSFRAISPFSVEWMDGSIENERLLEIANSYYFLTQDSVGCWIGSDTTNYFFHTQPFIDSITGSPKPWCVGDSVNLYAHSPFPHKWIVEDDSMDHVKVYQDGWYKVMTTLPPNCKSTDSFYVFFTPLPAVNFRQDTFYSLGTEMDLQYSSNTENLLWTFGEEVYPDYQDFTINSDGWLYLQAARKGCRNQDSAWIIFKELAKRAIPNAFTPNGDGLNEYWTFLHEDDSGTLKIFDRWGSRIYTGPPRWNGKIDGETVPVGTYQYIYQTKDDVISGKIHVVK